MSVAEETRTLPITRELWGALLDQGVLEGKHVQLIEGEIVELSPQKDPHASTIRRLTRILVPQVQEPWIVGVQTPVAAGPLSEPEPDVSVVLENPGDHPVVAALLIEVCDSTRRLDLVRKPRVYAQAGFPVYAVVDLRDRVLHVHTGPTEDGYLEKRVLQPGEPLILDEPTITLDIADVLPPE